MNKYVDPERLKNEIAKAPVWTSLTIIEIINKMAEPLTRMKTQNSNLTFEKALKDFIDDAPSIDIVRCKECVEYNDEWCMYWQNVVNVYDFCSYGERREP